MAKKLIAMLLAGVMVLMLGACGQTSTPETPSADASEEATTGDNTFVLEGVTYSYDDFPKSDIIIAKINDDNSNAWRAAMMKAWEECCAEMKSVGLIGDYYSYNVQGDEQVIASIQDAMNKGVDVLCVQGSTAVFGPIYTEALEAGIKVVATGAAGIPEALGENFLVIDGDNDEYMRGPTEAIAYLMGYEGKLVHLYGAEGGWDGGEVRKAAVRDVVSKYPGLEIVHGEPCLWSPSTANSVMTSLLSAQGEDLCGEHVGIIAEDVGLGVLQAYLAAGYEDNLPVILGDYTIGFMREWAKHDNLKAVCNCYAADYTYTFAHVAYLMANGFIPDEEACHNPVSNQEWTVVAPMPCIVVKDFDSSESWVENLLPTTEVRTLDEVLKWADENNLSDNDCILGHLSLQEVRDTFFE